MHIITTMVPRAAKFQDEPALEPIVTSSRTGCWVSLRCVA